MVSKFDPAVIVIIFLAVVLPEKTESAQDFRALEGQVDEMVRAMLACKPKISGVTLAVVKDGQPIVQKGYGMADREKNIPATRDTLFQIASLSKGFTTTLLMKVLDKLPNVTVNTPVTKILKGDFSFNDAQLNQYATIQDLMSHRLGLPSHNYVRLKDMTRAELAGLFKYIKPKGEFRSTFYYNNIVYGLLTYITEVLGGDTWENLMSRELYEPLGMSRTTFAHALEPNETGVAVGYQSDRDGQLAEVPNELSRQWGKLGGSGAIMSTAVDMTKWIKFHLSEGKNGTGHRVMSSRTIRKNHEAKVTMTSSINKYITVPEFPTTFVVDRYAAAWRNGYYRGLETVSHTGSTFGYTAILMLYPDVDLGIFIGLNGEDPSVFSRTALQSFIADLVLGYEPWLNTTSVCTFPAPWKETRPSGRDGPIKKDLTPTKPLDTYVGQYSLPLYGALDITKNKDVNCTNCLRMTYGISIWDLYPGALPNQFIALGKGAVRLWNAVSVMFNVPSGKSKAASLQLLSFDSKDPPTFSRVKPQCQDGCKAHQSASDNSGSPLFCTPWMTTFLSALFFMQFIF
ncbi:uncharacterized protein LOC135472974 [Liolophura sinensis]|uniref:uncharacterized protein LOC135472974 n=1 Tax=Liolophura sinensis TaxID=3198878 RepID=UPI0031587E26